MIALLSLAVLGGASFLFIRVAAPEFGPLPLMEIRVVIAGLLLAAAARATGQSLALGANWRRYLLLGALYGAIPYALIAAAALHIPAALAAVLNATTPMFSALVAALWLGDRLTPGRVAGLLIGLVGVAVTVGWSPGTLTGAPRLWTGAMLLSSLFYALGSVYAKKALPGVPGLAVAFGQQFGAAVLLLPGALLTWPDQPPAGRAIGALLLLAVLTTALTSYLFFTLVARIGPTQTLSVLFLVPLFGVAFGHLFLAEPVGWSLLTGLAIILAGVRLVIDRPGSAQRQRP